MFNHFVGLALKGLSALYNFEQSKEFTPHFLFKYTFFVANRTVFLDKINDIDINLLEISESPLMQILLFDYSNFMTSSTYLL